MKSIIDANLQKIKLYLAAKNEKDTYVSETRDKKEIISEEDLVNHWNIRAQRHDIQAVMSTRYTLEQNKESTEKFQEDFFDFLRGHFENKKIFEVGCGIGRMVNVFAPKVSEIAACDISPLMFERAQENLKRHNNVKLYLSMAANLDLPERSFDLVFTSTVLQHILNPDILKKTTEKMKNLSDNICIVEHTYQGSNFPISKYTILRNPEEYTKLFAPLRYVKQKYYFSGKDRLNMMLFQK